MSSLPGSRGPRIDVDVLERCLIEAGKEIDKMEDNFQPLPDKGEYPFSKRSKLLYAYLINK